MTNITQIWTTVMDMLAEKMTAVSLQTWFSDVAIGEYKDNRIILTAPHSMTKEVICDKYQKTLEDIFEQIFSMPMEIVVMTEEEFRTYMQGKEAEPTYMNDEFTFRNFVVGNSNRFAHGAAVAVSQMPAQVYNPLLIHGPSGVGKTHLLYAIAGTIKREHPEWRITYITAEDFTNEMVTAISQGKMNDFRMKYRQVNLLLVDDVQFLAGKSSTQEEFFHTFNALSDAHSQMVLTSDRPPKEIPLLEDRIRSRFESGLLADIQPPDFETRSAIILKKAAYLGLDMPREVVDFLAERISNNVRQLEGTVKKIKALRAFMGLPVNLETAQIAIEDIYRENPGINPTPQYIIETVATFYGVTPSDITGSKRGQDIMTARQSAIYLTRRLTKHSLPEIGAAFGGRDHTTIMHSINKIENALKKKKKIKANIETLIKTIRQE